MLIGIVEYNAKAALYSFVEEINGQQAAAWGVVALQRRRLKQLTNSEIVLALKPALNEVTRVKIFFVDAETVYVTWFGMPRQTFQKIKALVCQTLLRPGVQDAPERIVMYFDPLVMGDELNIHLKTQSEEQNISPPPEATEEMWTEENGFEIAQAQLERHTKTLAQKPNRQLLNILVVEDQSFLRNLLTSVLRTAYEIDAVASIKEAWEFYLDKAPDIVFLDINLPDGSGHALAHKIKELDPSAYIVMVTVSNQRDDVELAKNNHVDGFIVKPFNKKKISDCIDHYLSTHKMLQKKKILI